MNKVVALLPIKQHSERVKGKNFRMICGKPLYQWILESLLDSQTIARVVIDTDSENFINELNRLYPSVQTLLRPDEIRGGMVPMNDVIAYDMSQCDDCNHFVQTHTTNPLLLSATIDKAVKIYFEGLEKYDSLFTVNRIQARTYWKNGQPINHEYGVMQRTQDMEPIMEENSNLFIFSKESFAIANGRVGKAPLLMEVPKTESIEIDEEEDFTLAQVLLEARIIGKL